VDEGDGRKPSANERQDAMMRSIGRIALLITTAALLGGCTVVLMQEVRERYGWLDTVMSRVLCQQERGADSL